MRLWKISQTQTNDWDTYDSAVVAAETKEAAAATFPESDVWRTEAWAGWCASPADVTVEYLGEAKPGTGPGTIVSSFNAG